MVQVRILEGGDGLAYCWISTVCIRAMSVRLSSNSLSKIGAVLCAVVAEVVLEMVETAEKSNGDANANKLEPTLAAFWLYSLKTMLALRLLPSAIPQFTLFLWSLQNDSGSAETSLLRRLRKFLLRSGGKVMTVSFYFLFFLSFRRFLTWFFATGQKFYKGGGG